MTQSNTPAVAGYLDALALPLVKANGFSVVSDAGAADSDGDLHLLSLLGRKAAVEAIAAACLAGKNVLLYPQPGRAGVEVQAPADWAWRLFSSTRAGGEAHLVLLPRRADVTRLQEGAFTVAEPLTATPLASANGGSASAEADPVVSPLARLHYLFLSRALPTPLADIWDGWLWRRALARAEAVPLRCWGALRAAYACQPRDADLRADLGAALAGDRTYGPLPRPLVASRRRESGDPPSGALTPSPNEPSGHAALRAAS